MIDFELEPQMPNRLEDVPRGCREHMMRPISREYDEREHEKPDPILRAMWAASAAADVQPGDDRSKRTERSEAPGACANLLHRAHHRGAVLGRRRALPVDPQCGTGRRGGDGGRHPGAEGALSRAFEDGKPKWGAMAITEPGCGSDSAAVTTTATRDGDHWVINGTKIFCTAGQMAVEKSEGFVVVWATVDKSAGRAGIKPFVVEHDTPGMTVARVENKLGIRASDTAAIVFDNCRVPPTICSAAPKFAARAASRT